MDDIYDTRRSRNIGNRYVRLLAAVQYQDILRAVMEPVNQSSGQIGKGLYGVDMKEVDGKFYVIEINDNPNIDAGIEDKILKDRLYAIIMEVFLNKIKFEKQ